MAQTNVKPSAQEMIENSLGVKSILDMSDTELESFENQPGSRLLVSTIQYLIVRENQIGSQSLLIYFIGALYQGQLIYRIFEVVHQVFWPDNREIF